MKPISQVALGQVCTVIAGQHIEAKLYHTDASRGGVPYLTGPADFGITRPIIARWTLSPKVYAKQSDVLITVKGNGVGKCNLGVDAAIGRQLMALRPKPDLLDQLYLFHSLRSREEVLGQLGQGATVPGIAKGRIASVTIPLPDLNEQKRIAAILDKADAIRRKREQAIELAGEFLRSLFLDMFGNPATNPKRLPFVRIGDLMSSVTYGTSKKAYEKGAYPVLRMLNITYEGCWKFADLKFVDLDHSEIERFLVKKGDILFNRTNSRELVGKTAVFRSERQMAYAGYLIRMRTNEHAHPEYVSAFLNSTYMKRTLRQRCKDIIGMANINAKELQAFPIPLAPLPSQNAFASVVERVLRNELSLDQAVLDAGRLTQCLAHRAFRGEL